MFWRKIGGGGGSADRLIPLPAGNKEKKKFYSNIIYRSNQIDTFLSFLVETPQKSPPRNLCRGSLGKLRGDSGTPQGR